jgi:hypothetical protein
MPHEGEAGSQGKTDVQSPRVGFNETLTVTDSRPHYLSLI